MDFLKTEYTRYNHRNRRVIVKTALKGKHREHSLCSRCTKFNPEDRDNNCAIANAVYSVCVITGAVTPVWECPDFNLKPVETEVTN